MNAVIRSVLLVGSSAGIIFAAWVHRYTLSDQLQLAFYDPPAEIEQLAADADFSEYGKRLFFVSEPKLLLEEDFDTSCVFRELGLVLGCYDGREIFVLDVQDERLEPVESVTAAHEMLHVAYGRYSVEEKKELESLFARQLTTYPNQRILDEVAAYESDPNADIQNELHSIIGTEYAELIPELEQYYGQYFNDRSIVLGQSQLYEGVFDELSESIGQLDDELAVLRAQIDQLRNETNLSVIEISRRRIEVNALQPTQETLEEDRQLIADFNSFIDLHNANVNKLQGLIDDYNAIVVEKNKNVNEQGNLIKSLDSDAQTIE